MQPFPPSTGGRLQEHPRGERSDPAPEREVHRPGDREPQRGHHARARHGRVALAVYRPPVGACQLDLLACVCWNY